MSEQIINERPNEEKIGRQSARSDELLTQKSLVPKTKRVSVLKPELRSDMKDQSAANNFSSNYPLNEIAKNQNNSSKGRNSGTASKIKASMSQMSFHKPIRPKWKKDIDKFLNCSPVLIVMSIITVFALFASDIQSAWLDISVDEGFNIVQCIIMTIFTAEFILNCIAKEDYVLSFFFWLDLVATISLVQDIDYIMDALMGYEPVSETGGGGKKNSAQAAKAIAKVSSASRATRVLRVIRIVRLIRMVKLYKNVYMARELAEKKKEDEKKKILARLEKDMSNNSNSASKNNEGTSMSSKSIRTFKKTSSNNIPLAVVEEETKKTDLSPKSKINSPSALVAELESPVKEREENKETDRETYDKYKDKDKEKENDNDKENGKPKEGKKDKIELKNSQIKKEEIDEEELIKESKISKIITESLTKKVIVLILGLLVIFPLLSEDFYADDTSITYTLLSQMLSNRYHLDYAFSNYSVPFNITELFDESFPPINITYNGLPVYINPQLRETKFRFKEIKSLFSDDSSIHLVYSITYETQLGGILNLVQTIFVCICLTLAAVLFEADANTYVLEPLEIMLEIVEKVAKDPMGAKNVDELQEGVKAAVNNQKGTPNDRHADNYEVLVIKTAIVKISALLAIGFGDAGGEIITQNLSSGQELNARMKGKSKTAIFGFCDIRNFEPINLALEERTMLFVNQIAEIVHSSVDRFKGATNKNIGEAFLNVWKFYNSFASNGKKDNIKNRDNLLKIDPTSPQVGIIADCSILAFLRIILKINKNVSMLSYRKDEAILKYIPDFKLNMGFGLHMGYGIEGAVGSSYKIDASYLSPNVNISARLESATRQFGVTLLLSGVLYEKCTESMKSICRFVDCVMVKGSEQPLELYTIDLNLNVTPQEESKIKIESNKDKRDNFAHKKLELNTLIDEMGTVTELILEKQSYKELIKERTVEFVDNWAKGIAAYKTGNWKAAETCFKVCKTIDPEDGPVKTLYNYLNNRKFTAPEGWNGVRELTSK